ncbi:hypothetical protein [Craterilacuibacter sp. RT1T]|uniref:hypothetical protein n=1 Tax=Craterilacuibacter sp. RT1T TaxID=2942211 RepID=UPI0020BE830D|nr:hypothetical protein [Craterilacuibacter sp. RT1T]MCL6262081.1 hypothetical protein [Craterilacuibacter sp. RT1T]
MNIPDWFYGIASILAAFALAFLMIKKRKMGVKEDWFSTFGKSILILFMIAFGILLLAVSKS